MEKIFTLLKTLTAFRDLLLDPPATEREFVNLWKLYLACLLHGLLVEYGIKGDATTQLERALQQAGLKTSDNAMEFSLRQQFAQGDSQDASNTAKIVVPDDEAAPFPVQRQSYGRLLGMGGGLDIRV